jgi:hypothetical protein
VDQAAQVSAAAAVPGAATRGVLPDVARDVAGRAPATPLMESMDRVPFSLRPWVASATHAGAEVLETGGLWSGGWQRKSSPVQYQFRPSG